MRDEKLHAVVARSTFRRRNVQNISSSEHFQTLRCRKSVRRCGAKLFPSQNVQNTPGSEHFWKLRCSKSARRCGATDGPGPLLEVEMSKKGMPLWREAHFQVKMYKVHQRGAMLGPLLEVKMPKKCTPLWREARFEVKKCKKGIPVLVQQHLDGVQCMPFLDAAQA